MRRLKHLMIVHEHRHGNDFSRIVLPARSNPSAEAIAEACEMDFEPGLDESLDTVECCTIAPNPVGFARPRRRPSTGPEIALAAHLITEARARSALGAIALAAATRRHPLPAIRAALRRCGLAPAPRKPARGRR